MLRSLMGDGPILKRVLYSNECPSHSGAFRMGGPEGKGARLHWTPQPPEDSGLFPA